MYLKVKTEIILLLFYLLHPQHLVLYSLKLLQESIINKTNISVTIAYYSLLWWYKMYKLAKDNDFNIVLQYTWFMIPYDYLCYTIHMCVSWWLMNELSCKLWVDL